MKLEDALQQAFDHYGAGRLDRAETVCREILKAQPKQAAALHLLGAVAMRVGKNDIAIDLIGKAVANDPENAQYHANLGEAYRQTGRLDEAETHIRRALETDQNLASAHSNLGSVLLVRDKPDEAIAAFDAAMELDPNLVPPHYNKGNALAKKGDLDGAKECYKQALKIDPANAPAHFHLGAVALLEGREQDARRLLERSLQLDPNNALACHELGCLLQRENDAKNALPLHRRAVELSPGFADGYMGLSSALARTGKNAEANKAAHHAVRLNRIFEWPFTGEKPIGRIAVLKGVEDRHFMVGQASGEWTIRGLNNFDNHIDTTKFSQFCFYVDGLEPGRELESLPPCDLIFNAISDVDSKPGCHEIAKRIADAASVPVINHPDAIEQCQRHLNYQELHDLDGIICPKTIRLDGRPETKDEVAKLLDAESMKFPVLVRHVGTHAGVSLEKADDVEQAWTYFAAQPDGHFFITEFADFSIDSGEYVKMRVQVVDGQMYPNQLYIHDDWNIQGWPKVKQKMLETDWMLDKAETFLGDPKAYLGSDAYAGLESICDRIPLDFFGVDFGCAKDGRIVMFEANANMQIPSTQNEVIKARIPCIEAIEEAVQRLLEKGITGAAAQKG